MKSILIIKNIVVENANAISGLTYGFPSISQFLGFTHALSRNLENDLGIRFGGCSVVSHSHQIHAHPSGYWRDLVLSLTRNPLTKEGKTASFVEEGRMHMEISLLIECDFTSDDLEQLGGSDTEEDKIKFTSIVSNLIYRHKLCGGTIISVDRIDFENVPEASEKRTKFLRKLMIQMLPGFLLVDKTSYLKDHAKNYHQGNIFEAWLDFYTLKYQAELAISGDIKPIYPAIPNECSGSENLHGLKEPDISHGNPNDVASLENGLQCSDVKTKSVKTSVVSDSKSESIAASEIAAIWRNIPKPKNGWLVPIMIGFKGISTLYQPGDVKNTRDINVPFRFVEPIYGIGEWLSPRRVQNLEEIFWNYKFKEDLYLTINKK